MKKVLAVCITLVLVMSMCITAFAAPGAFVNSPSENPAPEVETFDPHDDGCDAELVITPYSERDTLPEDSKERIEDAYDDIVNSDDLTELNDDLAKIADDKNIPGEDLAVSDLFDLDTTGCDNHDDHHGYDVVLDADTLENFVALLYMDEDGKWHLVEDAKVTNNGEHLEFSSDAYGPYAIVVNAGKSVDTPQTGDDFNIHLYAIIMAVCAAAIVLIVVKSRKQSA